MTFTEFVHSHLAQLNFFAYAYLGWIVANYLRPEALKDDLTFWQGFRPCWLVPRLLLSLVCGGLTFFAAHHHIWIALYSFGASLAFAYVRWTVPPKFLAETEGAGNLTYAVWLVALFHCLHISPEFWGVGRFESSHVIAIVLITSIVIYVEIGGTNIVRGLLEKGRILPSAEKAPSTSTAPEPKAESDQAVPEKIDLEEYNHGRLIGNAERLLLLALVAIQAYQALAFLMTAKGLFRAKELESRSFSEYFLVGTLVSSLIAVAAGLTIQLVIKLCW